MHNCELLTHTSHSTPASGGLSSVIHSLFWLRKLGQEGHVGMGGMEGDLKMEGGDLPLGQRGSWTTAGQGRGHATWLPSPSHLLKAQPQKEKTETEPGKLLPRQEGPILGTYKGHWPIDSGRLKRIAGIEAGPWPCLTRDPVGLLHNSSGTIHMAQSGPGCGRG